VKGIDVSYAQGAIDWAKVKGQVDFAMLRTGYGWGEHQEDSRFSANAAGCQAQGIPFGVYHYSYALTPQEAKEEARSCLAILDNRPLQWPVAFDFEEKAQLALPPRQQLELIDAFLGEIERAGYFGMLYLSASPLERLYRAEPKRVERYALWVAHVEVEQPATTAPWGIWQHSWKGTVEGITGPVDLNTAAIDYGAVIEQAGLNRPDTADYRSLYLAKCRQMDRLVTEIQTLIQQYEGE